MDQTGLTEKVQHHIKNIRKRKRQAALLVFAFIVILDSFFYKPNRLYALSQFLQPKGCTTGTTYY